MREIANSYDFFLIACTKRARKNRRRVGVIALGALAWRANIKYCRRQIRGREDVISFSPQRTEDRSHQPSRALRLTRVTGSARRREWWKIVLRETYVTDPWPERRRLADARSERPADLPAPCSVRPRGRCRGPDEFR